MSRITGRGATGPLAIVANGAFQTSTDTSLKTLVGTRWDLSDGREVALVYNSSAGAVAAGKLTQSPAIVANHQNLVVTAYQAYSNNGNVPAKVTVTLGATAATANQYAGGYLIVNDNNGEGQTLKIASHPAADSSGSLAVTLEEGATVAITTASEVCLSANPYYDTIVCPTTLTGKPLGVTIYNLPVSSYGYVQTRGPVACLNDATTAIGLDLMPSSNTAGAVMTYVAATSSRVGTSTQAGVTTEYRLIDIQL